MFLDLTVLNQLALVSTQYFGDVAVLYILAVFAAHVIMGWTVHGDAEKIESKGGSLFLFDAIKWGALVFIFGLFGLAVYWAIHYSSLRDSRSPGSEKTD